MDEFAKIAAATVTEAFENMTKAVESMTPEARQAYAETFPIRIMFEAGIDENNSFAFAFSAN